MQYWEIWYPRAGATGIHVARGLVDDTPRILLHSPPEVLTAEVRAEDGERLAFSADLERSADSPMCRLKVDGDSVTREDIWPDEEDVGSIVLLPGGEAGVLKAWWNADDRMEWRWTVEFYNSIR
jgi:hypothetical protein